MPDSPQATEKVYYAIGEVSRMLGVPVPTLRYWEKEFDVIRPKKNRKGDRHFTVQDLEIIKLVHHMVKERGMTIEGARRALKADYNAANDRHQAVQSLKALRDFLVGLKDAIDQRGKKS
jgi:DNA-binding transcriptional MerR regulator